MPRKTDSDTQVLDQDVTDEQGTNGSAPAAVEIPAEVKNADTDSIKSQIAAMRAAAQERKNQSKTEQATLAALRAELKERKGSSAGHGGASTDPGIWVTYAAARIVRTRMQAGASQDEALQALYASMTPLIVGTLDYSASHDNLDLKLAARGFVRDDKPEA